MMLEMKQIKASTKQQLTQSKTKPSFNAMGSGCNEGRVLDDKGWQQNVFKRQGTQTPLVCLFLMFAFCPLLSNITPVLMLKMQTFYHLSAL